MSDQAELKNIRREVAKLHREVAGTHARMASASASLKRARSAARLESMALVAGICIAVFALRRSWGIMRRHEV